MNPVLKRTVLLAIVSCLSVSCSTSGRGSKDNSKSEAPVTVFKPTSSFELPEFKEKKLENGLTILYIPDDSLPYITYSLLVKGGGSTDPEGAAGLNAFVAELLEQGTSKRNALQVADSLAKMGSQFNSSVTSDYSLFTASGLATDAEPLIALFNEIITQPSFAAEEVDRAGKKLVAQLRRRVDAPEALVDVAWEESLYGAKHPYATPVAGYVRSVDQFRRKNIIQHYLKYYRPNNSILAVVGSISPEVRQKVESSFSEWEKREVTLPVLSEIPKVQGMEVVIVDKPGMVQSQIRMGHAGIRRQHPQFLTLRVANTILGGAFSSRLVNRVRRDLGLTYSISSGFDARQGRGPFEIATFTKNESLAQTIQESLAVVREFKEKGVTPVEVEQAKGYLAGIFPGSIETAEKLAFNLMVLRLYGISDDYLGDYLDKLADVSATDVNRAIRESIDPANMKVVVYTSAAGVRSQIKSLNASKVTTRKASEFQ